MNFNERAARGLKADDRMDEKAGKLIGEWQQLYSTRGNWQSQWTEIAQRIYPMESYLFQNYNGGITQGEKRTTEIFDSTGVLALQRFGAILDSLLTPRDQFWHQLRADDAKLMKNREVARYFETVNDILFKERYAATANFASQNQKQYLSLGAYGTGVMFIDALQGSPGLRYRNVHLGETYIRENHQGVIDAVCRHFPYSARQAMQKWGEKLPESIRTAAEKSPDQMFWFLHWVRPNEDRDPEMRDHRGMEFSSDYVCVDGQVLLEESGFRSFPYAVSRYFQCSNEPYGRSPAMDVLPALKTLNEQKKTMLKQGHRIVDPVLLAHDDGVLDGFDLTPGAINFGAVSSEGRTLVQTLPSGNVQAGKELMDDERQLINDTFLISLFQILTENPEMTATEVMERTREKAILLAPTLGRQQSEYLGPMIHRELDVLSRQGKLPPQPQILKQAKGEYKIVHDSPISRTMKAEGASGAMRAVQQTLEVVQATQDPSYLNYFNFDAMVPDVARISGTPESWINSPQQVMMKKRAQAQAQQTQTAIQAAPAVAGVIKAQSSAQKGGA
jgi:hypothetical protein